MGTNLTRVGGALATGGAELARLAGATLLCDGPAPVRGATVDSRLIAERRGALFVALPGAVTDGRRYLLDAIDAGAGALLVEAGGDRAIDEQVQRAVAGAAERGVSVLSVPSGVESLNRLAAAWRRRFDFEIGRAHV